MAGLIDKLNSRLGVILAALTLLTTIGTFIESRYVSAADMKAMVDYIVDRDIRQMEREISKVQRRIKRVEMVPENERTPWDVQELIEAKDEKEALLRELKRLEEIE